jgi:hypothetical protein
MPHDVKMGKNFRRKARFVADGHKTKTPAAMTYSSVVSRDLVRIALTIAALNDLDIMACNIQVMTPGQHPPPHQLQLPSPLSSVAE